MFVVNEDNSIYATRGDIVFFSVSAEDRETKTKYTFKAGDVLRIKVYGKKDAEKVVLQKDFPVLNNTSEVEIYLTEEDTKIGEVISKPVDYWYEVELNPDEAPQTIIGYNEDGAVLFKLFPEGADIESYEPDPEDFPVVDEELDMTSPRPVSNKAIAKAFTNLVEGYEKCLDAVSKLHVTPEMFGAVGDGIADDTEALQAALSNGKADCLLIGKYGISDTINITDGVSVSCMDGAEIIALETMTRMVHLSRTEIPKPQTISLTLDGKGLAETGLYVAYCANLFIQKLRTRDMTKNHIHIADGYECFMSDIYCRNNLEYDANRTITGIIMDGTDSRIENAVVVNCNVGFELNESVHCTGIHPWNGGDDYIKDSVGVKCNAICFIDGSEIDTMGIGVQQLNYFQVYLTNTRFMFTKAVADFTPVFIENNTRQVFCNGCIFGNIKEGKFTLATKESLLALNNCTFSDDPETDSKWVNNTGMGAKFYQLVISDGPTGVIIPSNGSLQVEFSVPGIREFDALFHTVAYDKSQYISYKLTPESDKITVTVFNHHTSDVTLRYSRLSVVLLRNNGDTLFTWDACSPS